MTLVEYLNAHRTDAASWPGGETTWKLLAGIAQGFSMVSMGGAGCEGLLNCHAVLQRIVEDKKADPILRADAARYLAGVKGALRKTYQLDPDAQP